MSVQRQAPAPPLSHNLAASLLPTTKGRTCVKGTQLGRQAACVALQRATEGGERAGGGGGERVSERAPHNAAHTHITAHTHAHTMALARLAEGHPASVDVLWHHCRALCREVALL